MQYLPEVSEDTEADYIPVEAKYFNYGCNNEPVEYNGAEEYPEIEQHHQEAEQYAYQEAEQYPYQEADSLEQEFMVFAADGSLLSHNVGGTIFGAEMPPTLVDYDTTYLEQYHNDEEPQLLIPEETSLDISEQLHNTEQLGIGVDSFMDLQRNIVLHVSVGGWNGISAGGWRSGNINITSNTAWNITRSVTWLKARGVEP